MTASLSRRKLLQALALGICWLSACARRTGGEDRARPTDDAVRGNGRPHAGIIGGGGWVTGGDIADDGGIIARCDTSGPIVCDPGSSEWRRLFKPGFNANGSLLDIRYGTGGGNNSYDSSTYDVAICAGASQTAYFVVMGYVWRTTDGGKSVTRTALAQKSMCYANEATRMTGKPLAVDPLNGDIVFFGSPEGLVYTRDGGAHWHSVSNYELPAPTAGQRMIVAFDRSSQALKAKTQGIFVFVNGSGLYRSIDGGDTWANIAGAPKNASHLRVGKSNGYVHLAGTGVDGADGQYRRWDGRSWIAPDGVASKSIAISASEPSVVWLCSAGGGLRVSLNDGASWSAAASALRVARAIPWHAWTNEVWMSNGDILPDPTDGALWMLEGIGAWKVDEAPTVPVSDVTWTETSRCIENTVGTLIDVTPDGHILFACHDRMGFVIPKDEVGIAYPSVHVLNASYGITHGQSIDYAFDDPSFLVAAFYKDPRDRPDGAFSSDGGKTWKLMPGSVSQESGHYSGGNIVALSTKCFVQVETNDGNLMRTIDGGATWSRCMIGDNLDSHGHHAYYLHRRVLVKDQYVAGQAYYYHVGDETGSISNLACLGIWKTIDYGANWTRLRNANIINSDVDKWHGKLRQFGDDDWLWCGGDGAQGLWRSRDGMRTWAGVGGDDDVFGPAQFGEVLAIGVGKAINPGEPKAVLASAHRQANPSHPADYSGYGFWFSNDGMRTWKRIAQFPDGHFSMTTDIAGCPLEYGVFYFCTGGDGLNRIDCSVLA